MPVMNGLVVSSGEKQVLRVLERYSGIIKVVLKVRFFDVITWETEMSYSEHAYLERTHYDFVVCRNEIPYPVIFTVEYNRLNSGYVSESDNNRNWKCKLKKEDIRKRGIPLITVTESDFPQLDEIIKEFILNLLLQAKEISNNYGRNFLENLPSSPILRPISTAFELPNHTC